MAWDVSKLGHRSHTSGRRWLKSKLVHRQAERFAKRFRNINRKNHKKEVINHEKAMGI